MGSTQRDAAGSADEGAQRPTGPERFRLSRRSLVTLGGVAGLAATGLIGTSVVSPTQAHSMVVAGRQRAGTPVEVNRIRYGEDPERQSGQLFVPDPQHWAGGTAVPEYPVIVFFHGGGWTDTSGPLYCQAAARDLARYGVAVWLPTYRGTPSPGGWPMTFQDVSDALDFVAELGDHAQFSPDLDRVHLTGHSAGGHLAAWVAARDQLPPDMPGGAPRDSAGRMTVRSTTPLAGVLDFEKAVNEDNDHWVVQVMGGRPEELPERYSALSPIGRLPLGIPVNVLHGRADPVVPVSTLRDFIAKHAETRNPGRVILLDGVEHNEFVDVHHRAWAVAREVCLSSVGIRHGERH